MSSLFPEPDPRWDEDDDDLVVDDDICAACGHEHINGRSGSCSLFTCPCETWTASL